MDEKLLYIATHLDCYRFHTPQARQLKREIQRWTVLPVQEQEKYAVQQKLLSRFNAMLSLNNPYLDCLGYPYNVWGSVFSGDITAASLEGCRTGSYDRFLTLRPPELQQGGSAAVLCDAEQMKQFSAVKAGQAKRVLKEYPKEAERRRKAKEEQLELSKKRMKDGPRLYWSLLLIVCYFIGGVQILQTAEFLPGLLSTLGMWEMSDRILILLIPIVAGLELSGMLLRGRGNISYIACSIYRIWLIFRMDGLKKNYARQEAAAASAAEKADQWYQKLSKAAAKDLEQLKQNPDLPTAQLHTAKMLERRHNARPQRRCPDSLWSTYRKWWDYPGARYAVCLTVLEILFVVLIRL